jgi:molybdopterin molybdotransferase
MSSSPAAPRPPMLSTAEALAILLAAARRVDGVETIDTLDAAGRILATAVVSPLDVPPMHTSSMDGYALRASDLAGASQASGVTLQVSQRVPAGGVAKPLAAGTAARIFTGATVPPGADTVVMQEMANVAEGGVTFAQPAPAGEWITQQGADIRRGSVILPAGTRLTPQALGLAASVGCAALEVVRKVRVAVFFTGDELTMPGEPLRAGAIYNSNRFTLRGLLGKLGCEVTDLGIVADRLDATRETLRRAAHEHDLILTCGGVSVGEEDHVKPAVEAEGRISMWQIAMKPGKPLAFGAVRRGAARRELETKDANEAFFIGLPGNPVSSFCTFLLFVRPFILRLAGVDAVEPRVYSMRADFTMKKGDRRNEFLRARVNEAGGLDVFGNQSSAVLTSTVWGDGLIDNPPDHAISAGETVRFIPFSELMR